jgi:hypothetical protein
MERTGIDTLEARRFNLRYRSQPDRGLAPGIVTTIERSPGEDANGRPLAVR